MRHRIADKKLNRDSKHRKALLKNLIASLFERGEITTTETKAKAVKGLVDKIIHKAQAGTVSARRVIAAFFGKRSLVNTVVDDIAPKMKDRSSGFTRMVRLGNRRGDNAPIVKMELLEKPTGKPVVEKEVKVKPVEGEEVKKVAKVTKVTKTTKVAKVTKAKGK
ncbi:MAG: 50S ribosomal protein L17 [Microgenomates group bacterium GW2011_GWF2_45_18]|nr:MAG: 50S ribosomal protein L17 [Microgenomates group bacterium GW2011_GWF1_44_10]KKU01994.1 MAG: 50S ribosomal protein L17 [Microgenomates group bacterium GW2011_GWF2_45_18]OGJ41181.1 MAG: 50S ribosomal protein L17 [Candidatus Pacebacteria bacterium RIFOXYB1_FULL_44_10]HAU99020.1 50S ribosomal protein L17 [Candidatus Paceibacterota bacterium]HAX01265.1 50S ribosomal protein L17 [Candidatus Paceibacterota bacterium]